jgi:thymidylate synthase
MKFDISNNKVVLLTTKKVFWKGVVEELLWFISGKTDSKLLDSKGVKIWNGNASREFLDSRGLSDRREGDLGPVYGWQWRHFGADYIDCDTDYTGQGFDQLSDVIDKIKNDPFSRKIILSAWNPNDLGKMALEPCHLFAQFYVALKDGKRTLETTIYQRSADVGLGVPFNLASYSLFCHMIARACGIEATVMNYVFGDVHIYTNHVDELKEQIKREPREFPTIKFTTQEIDIDRIKSTDIELLGYDPHPAVSMKMVV